MDIYFETMECRKKLKNKCEVRKKRRKAGLNGATSNNKRYDKRIKSD